MYINIKSNIATSPLGTHNIRNAILLDKKKERAFITKVIHVMHGSRIEQGSPE